MVDLESKECCEPWGEIKGSEVAKQKARDYLEDFHQAQEQLIIPMRHTAVFIWQPPLESIFKLNFDATIFFFFFSELNNSDVGAIICNEKGKVIAFMLVKGTLMGDSEEVETLACRKVLEFAIDIGFSKIGN